MGFGGLVGDLFLEREGRPNSCAAEMRGRGEMFKVSGWGLWR
jgi:hypothetical protein